MKPLEKMGASGREVRVRRAPTTGNGPGRGWLGRERRRKTRDCGTSEDKREISRRRGQPTISNITGKSGR